MENVPNQGDLIYLRVFAAGTSLAAAASQLRRTDEDKSTTKARRLTGTWWRDERGGLMPPAAAERCKGWFASVLVFSSPFADREATV